jgi:Na+/H+ antiporter NhaD/arsenite permease-like protein
MLIYVVFMINLSKFFAYHLIPAIRLSRQEKKELLLPLLLLLLLLH